MEVLCRSALKDKVFEEYRKVVDEIYDAWPSRVRVASACPVFRSVCRN